MEKEICCEEVIISRIARRGNGKSLISPIRIITQVFAKDGTLIAEHDPSPETFPVCELMDYADWVIKNKKEVNTRTVEEWFGDNEPEKETQF
jgi:hypothetical protein